MANNFQIIHLRAPFFSFWHTYLCVLDDFSENCWKFGHFTIILSDEKCRKCQSCMWKSTFERSWRQITFKLFIWGNLFFSFWYTYLCVLEDFSENCWKFGHFTIILSDEKCRKCQSCMWKSTFEQLWRQITFKLFIWGNLFSVFDILIYVFWMTLVKTAGNLVILLLF